MKVWTLFYNHDDDGNVESLEGIYTDIEKAQRAAQQGHEDYEGEPQTPLVWERLKDWSVEAYEAYRDRNYERYFHIVEYEVK